MRPTYLLWKQINKIKSYVSKATSLIVRKVNWLAVISTCYKVALTHLGFQRWIEVKGLIKECSYFSTPPTPVVSNISIVSPKHPETLPELPYPIFVSPEMKLHYYWGTGKESEWWIACIFYHWGKTLKMGEVIVLWNVGIRDGDGSNWASQEIEGACWHDWGSGVGQLLCYMVVTARNRGCHRTGSL